MIVADHCTILHVRRSDREISGGTPMKVINHQQSEREVQRMQASREELVERIAQAIPEDGTASPLQGYTSIADPCLWSRVMAY